MSSATCLICSEEWEINEARVNTHLYCKECRKPSERKIDYGHADPCIPWNGDFDDEDNPLRGGVPYLPGIRTCNHRDCVQKAHIILEPAQEPDWKALIAERNSIYYRNRKRRSYEQLMTTLEKEKVRPRV